MLHSMWRKPLCRSSTIISPRLAFTSSSAFIVNKRRSPSPLPSSSSSSPFLGFSFPCTNSHHTSFSTYTRSQEDQSSFTSRTELRTDIDKTITKLLSENDVRSALLHLEEKAKEKSYPSARIMYQLLNTVSKKKLPEAVLAVYRVIKSANIRLYQAYNYNNILSALLTLKAPNSRILTVYTEMTDLGISPDIVTYTLLIRAFGSQNDFDKVAAVVKEMEERGIELNVIITDILFRLYSQRGKTAESALLIQKLLGKGRELKRKEGEGKEMEMDITFFNNLLKSFIGKGDELNVGLVRQVMISKKLEPDIFTYNILLDLYCSKHKLQETRKMLQEMKEKGLSPNIVTYNLMIDRLLSTPIASIWNSADFPASSASVSSFSSPPASSASSFTSFASSASSASFTEKEQHVFSLLEEMMKKKETQPDLVTINILLKYYCLSRDTLPGFRNLVRRIKRVRCNRKEARIEEGGWSIGEDTSQELHSHQHLEEFQFEDFEPGKREETLEDEVQNLLKELRSFFSFSSASAPSSLISVEPNVVTYTTMLEFLFRRGETGLVRKFFQEMTEERKITPNLIGYTVLIKSLVAEENLSELQQILEKMAEEGIKPDSVLFLPIIILYSKKGSAEQMKQVFDWVKLQGVDINEKVYGALLKGYIEVGYQEGVSELKTEMRAKGIKI